MKTIRLTFVRFTFMALAAALFSTVLASAAHAQIQRTAVSLSGTDAGNCAAINPCRSFNYALTQTAAGGEIIALTSAGYGPVTINKSVQIIAPGGVHAALTAFSGNGITVAAGAGDSVVLRGLTLTGLGATTGISFQSGGSLHVENCVISGFSSNGIEASADGEMFLKDSYIRNNGGDGLAVSTAAGTARVTIDRTRLERNANGVAARNNARVVVRDSIAANNTTAGLTASPAGGAATQLLVENSLTTGNASGIVSDGAATIVRVSGSTVTRNTTGLQAQNGGQLLSRVSNTVEGNTADGSFTSTFPAR